MNGSIDLKLEADIRELLGRCLGRTDIAQRILRKFQDCVWSDLRTLERAVAAGSMKEIAHVAHRMKGSALVVSARTLSQCAAELEVAAVEEAFEELEPSFTRLQAEAARLREVHATMQEDLTGVH